MVRVILISADDGQPEKSIKFVQPIFFRGFAMRRNFIFLSVLCLFVQVASAQTKNWTLRECVEYALERNIQVRQTALEVDMAKISKDDAFGNFLPQMNGQANHSWNIGLNQNITTGLLENQTTQFTSAGFNASVDIYGGLRNQIQLRRSNLAVLAANYQLDRMKDDIALNVASAFVQILFNKENLKVQQEQRTNNQKQLERTQELVAAGSVPRADLLDMEATLASSALAVVQAENQLLLSKLSLAQLLQLEDFRNFDIAPTDAEATPSSVMLEDPEQIIARAKEVRSEIKLAETNRLVAEQDVALARAAYQPTLQGYYSFSTRAAYADRIIGFAPDLENPFSTVGVVQGTDQAVLQPNFVPVLGRYAPIWDQFSDNKGHNFGLQLTIPILNGFSVRNNVARNKVALERSKIALEQTQLDLERNVYQALWDARGAFEAYQSAQTVAAARELSYEYAKEKYEVGMINAFDFNQVQTLHVNAQSDVARAKYDYIFKVKVVEFYFGIPINQL